MRSRAWSWTVRVRVPVAVAVAARRLLRLERMVTNRPIRNGKPVTESGLRRAMRADLRAAIRKTKTRVQKEDRRIEADAKASDAGLTTDDLLEVDRRRLKKETEK